MATQFYPAISEKGKQRHQPSLFPTQQTIGSSLLNLSKICVVDQYFDYIFSSCLNELLGFI